MRIEASDCEAMSVGSSCRNGIVSTGFFVRVDGELFIATTLHGVAHYPQIYWSAQNGKTETTSIARVNTKSDLALLAVLNADDVIALGFMPLEVSNAGIDDLAGKPVISMGFKLGLRMVTVEQDDVRILAPRQIADLLPEDIKLDPDFARFFASDAQTLQLELRLDPGDSGGPILLGRKVVGISHGGIDGTSLSWAMPAAELLNASSEEEDVNLFLADSTVRRHGQDAVIRLFNTDNEITETHIVAPPLRYTFMLRFSSRTRLLSGYASRVGWYTGSEDNPGYWFPGDGPISPNSEAFPGSPITVEGLWSAAPGERETLEAIQRDELEFLDLLSRAAIRLECQTEDRLGQPGKPYWPSDTFHSLELQHAINLDAVEVARDRGDVFVYSRTVQDVTPFGKRNRFASSGVRGKITDIDLKFGLCAVNLVPKDEGGTDQSVLKPLNDALRVGTACIVFYLSDGTELQLFMVGQSIDPALDPERLYGILTHTGGNTGAGACDER
ncbi:trypsin-like peptidase domain-containing protein [Mesorhizobium sp. WSM2239]|uniref:trypsin-like peptidase domain-containing protein n=1 Tax=unclassified Mesorhizobium TaxID=325217 RepID=UPI00336BF250